MQLTLYIDVYGGIGVVKKFPDDEEHCGLNDMLDILVDEDFYGDRYTTIPSGFYVAEMEIDVLGVEDEYLQIKNLRPRGEEME